MTKSFAKTFLSLCIGLALLMLVPGQAAAQDLLALGDSAAGGDGIGGAPGVLWDQGQACGGNGPASQRFPDFGDAVIQSADDFDVPDGVTWAIESVGAGGTFFNANPDNGPIDAVIVQIWSDAGGLPDTMLCEEVGANELADPDMGLTLSGDCTAKLDPGTYWLSVMAEMPFVPAGQLAWLPNDSTNGNEFAFQDPGGLTGNPCTTWGAGITDCGIGASFPDLCFVVNGVEQPIGPPPNPLEIPTLGQVGLGLLLLSLLGAGLYRLRRR
jgi:hypothetical protein